jgi:DNA-binding GntR family transcriptional regulator
LSATPRPARVAASEPSEASARATRAGERARTSTDISGRELRLAGRKDTSNGVADQVYRRLRRAIIEGEILPRSRLVELELAAALGASRTPVREAISRLTGDRLVAPLSGGGVEVVDTSRELGDIYCIREALEGAAARLAAERISDAELDRLDELVEGTRQAAPEDLEARVRINNEFHDLITRASRSERLVAMVDGFREFFLTQGTLEKYGPRESERALRHHVEIAAALRARDGRRAESLVRRHRGHDMNATRRNRR